MTSALKNPVFYRAHRALHTLWTKAVGTEGYIKAEWNELDAAIDALWRMAKR
jgi:hypothetical protein